MLCVEFVILWRLLFVGKRQGFLIMICSLMMVCSSTQITYTAITNKYDGVWIHHPVTITCFMTCFVSFLTIHWAFVGRYWKIALLLPFAIRPGIKTVKPPTVGWPLYILWVSIIVIYIGLCLTIVSITIKAQKECTPTSCYTDE